MEIDRSLPGNRRSDSSSTVHLRPAVGSDFTFGLVTFFGWAAVGVTVGMGLGVADGVGVAVAEAGVGLVSDLSSLPLQADTTSTQSRAAAVADRFMLLIVGLSTPLWWRVFTTDSSPHRGDR